MATERLSEQPERVPSSELNVEEERRLIELLAKLDKESLPPEIFWKIAGLIPQPIVEIVVLRDNNGVVETILLPRPDDEPVEEWKGKYHTPGSALRNSDFKRLDEEPFNGPFERIQRGELERTFAYPPKFYAHLAREGARGPELVVAYFTELEEGADIKPGQTWYPVDQLSQNPLFLQHQLNHVQMAKDAYLNLNQTSQ